MNEVEKEKKKWVERKGETGRIKHKEKRKSKEEKGKIKKEKKR